MRHTSAQETHRADRTYTAAVLSAPYLTAEEEENLARRWHDHKDERALHRLIESHGRLAQAIARRFRYYGLPAEDLGQEANIGLLQAAQRFNPDRGVRFSTYAAWWIRAAVQDYILRNWSIVRTGTTSAQKSLFFNFRRLRAEMEAQENAPLNHEGRAVIAQKLGVRLEDVHNMEVRLGAGDRSLDAFITGDQEENTRTWGDLLADPNPTSEEGLIERTSAQERSSCLSVSLTQLPQREQDILRARHLSEKEDNVTLETLGSRLGISKERVRQLEEKALGKLSKLVQSCVHRVYG